MAWATLTSRRNDVEHAFASLPAMNPRRRNHSGNVETKKSRANPAFSRMALLSSVLAQHRYRDVDDDVGVQRHRNRVVANNFQRTARHPHLAFFDREAL